MGDVFLNVRTRRMWFHQINKDSFPWNEPMCPWLKDILLPLSGVAPKYGNLGFSAKLIVDVV
jgi:hypothetical protein